ncbi:MAG: site-specific integrase [Acidobacteria bacterium]|nr:site-specific integrase [Acidobacteriota bacterium]
MQKGTVRVHGKWWLLKVRENVVKNGKIVRKDMYHKLAPVAQYRPSSNGEPPQTVRAMADEKLAPINAGKREGLSADSWKSYLQDYLQAGIGSNGRPVRRVTLKGYRRDFKIICDLIPDIQLRNVRTPDINRLFRALIEKDGDDMRATTSYRHVRNFLSGAFRAAVGDGLVDFNPVRDAMVMSGRDIETHAYSLAEVKKLLTAIRPAAPKEADDWRHTMRAAFLVAFFTGLRLEEIKGLKWTDYDKQAGLLNIRRTVVNRQIVEDTKTKSSKVPVVVVKTVAKQLEAHRKRNSGDGFIFHQAYSSQVPIIFEHIMLNQVQPICREAGITFPVQMHAFRRGLDTAMKDLAIDLSLRTDIMRHSPRNVTDKHYGRASVTQMRAALEKVEAEYQRAKAD